MDIRRVGFRSMPGTEENQGIDCTTDLFRGLLLTNLMALVITGNLTLNSNSIERKDWECHTGDHI